MDYVVNLVNMFEDKDSPFLEKIFDLEDGTVIRQPNANEKKIVLAFVAENFSDAWVDELAPAFNKTPVTSIIATDKEGKILGFAGIDGLRRGFFGPTGVIPSCRKKGVGRAILIEAMRALYFLGFPYGIIGGVDPNAQDFYKKVLGEYVSEIPNSTPGIYRNAVYENNADLYKEIYSKNKK